MISSAERRRRATHQRDRTGSAGLWAATGAFPGGAAAFNAEAGRVPPRRSFGVDGSVPVGRG
jgi:hypothetical protein